MADGSREKESKRLIALRDRLVEGLSKIPKSRVNGHLENRLPNNVNISFMDFAKAGLPVALICLLLSALWIAWL